MDSKEQQKKGEKKKKKHPKRQSYFEAGNLFLRKRLPVSLLNSLFKVPKEYNMNNFIVLALCTSRVY